MTAPELPELTALASELKAAQDSAGQIEPFTARFADFDVPSAYRVADLVHRTRLSEGATAVGRKLGFTNAGIWEKYGVGAPIWGYVYDQTVLRYDHTVVRLGEDHELGDLGRFAEPRIEPEIVFGLRTAPPDEGDLTDVRDAIHWIALGFEVVQSHFPSWRFGAADTVADAALHGMLVVGPPRPLTDVAEDVVRALERFELTLTCDGRTVASGRGSNVLGSPLAAVRHLASVLRTQPGQARLGPGELVTTGTLADAYPLRVGQTWRAEVEGIDLPELTVTF